MKFQLCYLERGNIKNINIFIALWLVARGHRKSNNNLTLRLACTGHVTCNFAKPPTITRTEWISLKPSSISDVLQPDCLVQNESIMGKDVHLIAN